MRPKPTKRSAVNRRDCPRCKRARWVLTILMLATMTAILYLNHFAG